MNALRQEICWYADLYPNMRATTLYLGGGTPSLLSAKDVSSLIQAVRQQFSLVDDAEITLEANPGTITALSLRDLRRAGVNRLSFGAQSSQANELRILGRIHTWPEVVDAFASARHAGFDNISLDLIFGLPGQTLPDWERSLLDAAALEPQHLSLYALTLEPETSLAKAVTSGVLPIPDPDLAAEMYELASAYLHSMGFWQYEISNWVRGVHPAPQIWALPPNGRTEDISPWVSRHNLVYWRNRPWFGFGAGAHSWFDGRRWHNVLHPLQYIQLTQQGDFGGVDVEAISSELERGESMMMGLRLAEGVTETRFYQRFGVGLAETYPQTLTELSSLGLLAWNGSRARLSAQGRLLGNQVFGAFLL